MKEACAKLTPEQKKAKAEKCSQKLKGRKKGSDSEEVRLHKKQAAADIPIERRLERVRKAELTKIKHTLEEMINLHIELTDENYVKYKYDKATKQKKNQGVALTKYFKDINEAVEYFKLNHKVKKVERIVLPNTPVYDISIKNYANFLVEAGVILHNCKDFKYRIAYNATKGGYNSGTPELRPSDITNPHDTKGAGCKHINLVIGNIDWVMKIASVINNYIHYMEENYQRLYADVIFPKLFGMPYQRAVQLNLFDTGSNELQSGENEIRLSNRYGRERGKFRSDIRINNMRNFRGPRLEQHDYENDFNNGKTITNNGPTLEQNISNKPLNDK